MRENHLETPRREHSLVNRRTKSISDHSKKSRKINRKSLNEEFSAAAADVSAVEPEKDAIQLSSISDVSDINLITESAGSFITPLAPAIEPTSEMLCLADLTPSSSITTLGFDKESSDQSTHSRSDKSQLAQSTCVETEMLAKQIKELTVQVLNSSDVNSRSRKLLDVLVNTMVEEFYGIPDDKEWLAQLIMKKAVMVLLSLLLWVLLVSVVLLCMSSGQQSSTGVRPT